MLVIYLFLEPTGPAKKQIPRKYRYIENESSVKPKARKMGLWENEKDESIGSDSPSDIGI
jgi:hypothetical protein